LARKTSAILLISCPDRPGLVAAITQFLSEHDGNILDLDQHVDMEENVFFARIEWDLARFTIPRDQIWERFDVLAQRFRMTWELHFSDKRTRMAVLVSRAAHCLYEILAHHEAGDWAVEIPLVISNHAHLESVVKKHGIDYYHLPVTKETRKEQESKVAELLEKEGIELVALARYMQILTPEFVDRFPNRLINIHHSFLPSFTGPRPYHRAYSRGVKNIGATAHYVTAELDGGPIVEQDVIRVSHRDSVEEFIRKGKGLEKSVLSRAIWFHLQRKVIVYGNKTMVFE
jgi:formyltetrahydrofolate deformylase